MPPAVIKARRALQLKTIEDDGKGLELPPKKGLGLTLVEGFAQQIQGHIEYVPVETGCKIIFCFPVYMT